MESRSCTGACLLNANLGIIMMTWRKNLLLPLLRFHTEAIFGGRKLSYLFMLLLGRLMLPQLWLLSSTCLLICGKIEKRVLTKSCKQIVINKKKKKKWMLIQIVIIAETFCCYKSSFFCVTLFQHQMHHRTFLKSIQNMGNVLHTCPTVHIHKIPPKHPKTLTKSEAVQTWPSSRGPGQVIFWELSVPGDAHSSASSQGVATETTRGIFLPSCMAP